MSYNKKAHLRANIDAIKLVFALEKEQRPLSNEEHQTLIQYSGFGGLKCVLNPASSLTDVGQWAKSELELFPMVAELHRVIKDNTNSEQEYKDYINSIKNSVLTAFYTPSSVVQVIADTLKINGIVVDNFLDPSAGLGEFGKAFNTTNPQSQNISFEKDLLTGKMLSLIYPDSKVNIEGFENIESRYNGHFDLVSSNIPFGEINIFDSSFKRNEDKVYQQSTKSIHNYFFVKGINTLREGGILAFITSQGVMNSSSNEPIRQWLMKNTNLVSAIRLPNNLFTEIAGTEVGSDLIILQKNTAKQELNNTEKLFVMASIDKQGIVTNNLFQDSNSIIHTKTFIGTDPYGKKAHVFEHDGGVDGITKDLGILIEKDFRNNLNIALYQNEPLLKPNLEIENKEKTQYQALEMSVSEPIVSLYDLFGFSQEERTQVKPKKRQTKANSKPIQLDMFSNKHKLENSPKIEPQRSLELRLFLGDIKEYHKEGSLVEDDGQIGYLKNKSKELSDFQPLDIHFAERSKISRYIEIRDFYHTLYNYEAKNLQVHESLRSNLNLVYNNFVRRYGVLNDKKNLDVIKMDPAGKEMLSLERFVDGKFEKADIFNKPVAFNPNEISHAETPYEALAASLNKYGEIQMDYMQTLLDDKSIEDITTELKGKIYYNPLVENYEIKDKFISGNVIEKSESIEAYIQDNPNDTESKYALEALKESIPIPIQFDELDFNFGERWIPINIYKDYASKLFDTDVQIDYYASRDDFTVKAERSNMIINEKFAVQSESRLYTGIHLLKNALLNTTPSITKSMTVTGEDGQSKTIKVADGEAIQLANTKIDEIRNGFTDWLQEQSPEFRNNLADQYNRKFNCYVRPQFDGSHQNFPDLNLKGLGIPDLYQSQKDCIWMQKMNGGGIADHEVGAGKTLIMCVSAYEMKRLGLVNKPMILALKANVHEIAETFRTAYPNAKLLYPGKEDFTPDKRVRIFNDIKNNSWDAIILTHDQFGKIPQSPEMQQKIFRAEMDSVEENLNVLRNQGKDISKMMLRGLEKRKANLEVKLANVADQIKNRTDDVVDFNMMGIDHLFIDESHRFKNLAFTTRHDRVAGLGNPEGSQRAMNMLFALRTIQERTGKDLGATFLSGTTISNSLTELYLLFKYLRPKELEKQNINSFDAWAAIFAKKTTDYEFSVTNQIVQKERFRYFIKVPELANFYSEITDFRTAKDIGIDRPEKNEILYNIPPTPDQAIFIEKLMKFAETADATLLGCI